VAADETQAARDEHGGVAVGRLGYGGGAQALGQVERRAVVVAAATKHAHEEHEHGAQIQVRLGDEHPRALEVDLVLRVALVVGERLLGRLVRRHGAAACLPLRWLLVLLGVNCKVVRLARCERQRRALDSTRSAWPAPAATTVRGG
jgi:hypothetical protein